MNDNQRKKMNPDNEGTGDVFKNIGSNVNIVNRSPNASLGINRNPLTPDLVRAIDDLRNLVGQTGSAIASEKYLQFVKAIDDGSSKSKIKMYWDEVIKLVPFIAGFPAAIKVIEELVK
jgi:hypothetical protein